jgi:regulator of protease activity HflC (stomatin/prohibitin superfamily)
MSIEESTLGVSERFGKFQSIEQPGCLCFPVGIVKVKTISVRTRQLHVVVESTTNDKVFVTINIEVQFRVDKQRVYEAFYSLEDVDGQIKAYIMDSVRDKVPDKDLDKLMKKKHKLAVLIQEELTKEMSQFGYEIVKVLILEIEPGKEVKAAMNDINTAERQRAAAIAKAEANKIVKIKEAEADAEARELAGKIIKEAFFFATCNSPPPTQARAWPLLVVPSSTVCKKQCTSSLKISTVSTLKLSCNSF